MKMNSSEFVFGKQGIQIGTFWQNKEAISEETEKLHIEKPWNQVKAIANLSYKIADVINKEGNWGKLSYLETALIKVPSSLLINSSN